MADKIYFSKKTGLRVLIRDTERVLGPGNRVVKIIPSLYAQFTNGMFNTKSLNEKDKAEAIEFLDNRIKAGKGFHQEITQEEMDKIQENLVINPSVVRGLKTTAGAVAKTANQMAKNQSKLDEMKAASQAENDNFKKSQG